MAKRDYYEVLGVKRSATEIEIKSAYRGLAKEHHPDRNAGDKEAERQFKEVNEAYEALKDPQKRAAYDQFGHAAFEGGRGGPGFGPDFASSMSDIFDDLFGEFMGGRRGGGGQGRSRTGREAGADLRYNLEITLPKPILAKRRRSASGKRQMRDMLRLRRQTRHESKNLHDLRRHRESPRGARLLHD